MIMNQELDGKAPERIVLSVFVYFAFVFTIISEISLKILNEL